MFVFRSAGQTYWENRARVHGVGTTIRPEPCRVHAGGT